MRAAARPPRARIRSASPAAMRASSPRASSPAARAAATSARRLDGAAASASSSTARHWARNRPGPSVTSLANCCRATASACTSRRRDSARSTDCCAASDARISRRTASLPTARTAWRNCGSSRTTRSCSRAATTGPDWPITVTTRPAGVTPAGSPDAVTKGRPGASWYNRRSRGSPTARASRRSSESASLVWPSSTTSPAKPLSVATRAGRTVSIAMPHPATLTATSGSSADPRPATASSTPAAQSRTPTTAAATRGTRTA